MVLYRLRRFIARRFFALKVSMVDVPVEFDLVTVSIPVRRR